MRKTKEQKAITLIALVITIVVLLILAAVAISSIINDGVLSYAENGAKEYNQAVKNEQDTLQGYVDWLNQHTGGSGSSEGENTGNVSGNPITKEDSYIGYYADIDADGDIDGIIFADLAFDKEGMWGDVNGIYSYEAKSNLNNYTVRDAIEEERGLFKDAIPKVIVATENRLEENDRFYVMALSDFRTEDYLPFWLYWYRYAYGKMDPLVTEVDFGTGRENTDNIIDIWNKNGATGGYEGAIQYDGDIWKYINEEIENGWFVPSRAEWAAFCDSFNIWTMNFYDFGLLDTYWSSSQKDMSNIYYLDFNYSFMYLERVDGYYIAFRMCTTF